ncbi:MAG: nucleotidyltransferase domain-containing protein [Magnetococcales bacterium]|nr:nucleotidyltransferase domain-containing protein [Magnetococcales bacterium]
MGYGLSDGVLDTIRTVWGQFPAVERVVLYGSRAKGSNRPGSDIDLALFAATMTVFDLVPVEEALEELMLPYLFDLTLFSESLSVHLQNEIIQSGVEIYRRPIPGNLPTVQSEAATGTGAGGGKSHCCPGRRACSCHYMSDVIW